jgi:hypothetical protein
LMLCRLLLLIASLALLFASPLRSPSLVRNVLLMVCSTSTWSSVPWALPPGKMDGMIILVVIICGCL